MSSPQLQVVTHWLWLHDEENGIHWVELVLSKFLKIGTGDETASKHNLKQFFLWIYWSLLFSIPFLQVFELGLHWIILNKIRM